MLPSCESANGRQTVLHQKPLATFSMANLKDQKVKISPAFLERLINTVRHAVQMYKVRLRNPLNVAYTV